MARLYILFALTFVAQLSLISGNAVCPTECPTYWTAWNNHCYRYFGYQTLSWHDALARCRSYTSAKGGHADLVSIHSRAEQDFVYHYWRYSRDFISSPSYLKPALWIGLTDRNSEGHFKWSDGGSMDYQNWGPGEPNNADNSEDNVNILDFGDFVNKWNELPAHQALNYMCKMAK